MKINIGRLTEILNRKVDLEGSIQKIHIDTSDDDLNLFVNNNDVAVLQEYQDKRRFKVDILNGKYRNPWYANPQKYLGISWNADIKRYDVGFGNGERGEMFRFELSAKEIEALKKDKDLAIDWDKVELEVVYDAE